jgi:hypothetical protein
LVAELTVVLINHLVPLPNQHIHAHLNFVTDFISDAMHLGIGGYALASFQYALTRIAATQLLEPSDSAAPTSFEQSVIISQSFEH